MTTILKEMGIQQWRLRQVGIEPMAAPVAQAVVQVESKMEQSLPQQRVDNGPVNHESISGGPVIASESIVSRPLSDSLVSQAPVAKPPERVINSPSPVPSPMPAAQVLAPIAMPMPVNKAIDTVSSPLGGQKAVSHDSLVSLDWEGLQALIDGQSQCHSCGRGNSSLGGGNANADWLFVSDAPTRTDLEQNQFFSGRSGQLYEAMLLAVGLDRASVYTTSVFKCAASDDLHAVPNCDKLLQLQIDLVKPKVIIAFGEFAAQSVAKSNEGLEKLRGQELTCHYSKVPIIASYSLLQLLDEPSLKAGAWQDLQKCIAITR